MRKICYYAWFIVGACYRGVWGLKWCLNHPAINPIQGKMFVKNYGGRVAWVKCMKIGQDFPGWFTADIIQIAVINLGYFLVEVRKADALLPQLHLKALSLTCCCELRNQYMVIRKKKYENSVFSLHKLKRRERHKNCSIMHVKARNIFYPKTCHCTSIFSETHCTSFEKVLKCSWGTPPPHTHTHPCSGSFEPCSVYIFCKS